MGRFETLNADTQDLVQCLLPALASSFHVKDAVDIIPEDIRMRAWDCERRDHIKDQTENDPRNWGVQFLKDLKAIARLNKGNLSEFHARLRAKVDKHEVKHPWCRLSDIKELKDEYENPNRPAPQPDYESSASSIDSYLEELHEPELPRGAKNGRKRNHEMYETRLQLPRKREFFGPVGTCVHLIFYRRSPPSC
jgi:ATP-dependent exoDNAse (exonuclease V) beta subunit